MQQSTPPPFSALTAGHPENQHTPSQRSRIQLAHVYGANGALRCVSHLSRRPTPLRIGRLSQRDQHGQDGVGAGGRVRGSASGENELRHGIMYSPYALHGGRGGTAIISVLDYIGANHVLTEAESVDPLRGENIQELTGSLRHYHANAIDWSDPLFCTPDDGEDRRYFYVWIFCEQGILVEPAMTSVATYQKQCR